MGPYCIAPDPAPAAAARTSRKATSTSAISTLFSSTSSCSCRSNHHLNSGGAEEGLWILFPSLRIRLQPPLPGPPGIPPAPRPSQTHSHRRLSADPMAALMAVVLPKVFGSVLHRSGSSSSHRCQDLPQNHPPLGDLNLIPADVFVQILLLRGPPWCRTTVSGFTL